MIGSFNLFLRLQGHVFSLVTAAAAMRTLLLITGRVDDVINVSATAWHREVESALVGPSKSREAAVVGYHTTSRDRASICYVTLMAGDRAPTICAGLVAHVRKEIGRLRRPTRSSSRGFA